ncbi:maltase A3-like [Culicoides brevitarsis]|uniref:maltase A3-like n=1 Tax=Culicoides brevitarsis TaxID=469753 RepID=UPI00307C830E
MNGRSSDYFFKSFCTFIVFFPILLLSFGTVRSFDVESIKIEQNFIQKNRVQKDWWQTAAFYQIYPRSFKDSNGDGIGDLPGITEKLPYLKQIGINAFWLSPIYPSPMADFGYDISDFYNVAPEYGTMEDFKRLVQEAKKLGLKVILDFVPNHSSDENEWFKKSAARDPEYKDFYIWHPGRNVTGDDGRPLPPCNWLSLFRGSAWRWHETRQEYYFHQFHYKQPDLNYRNPAVVERMKGVLRYWLSLGVDGFRIDAVPSLFEVSPDAEGNFPDEPRNSWNNDPNDWNYLQHIYTQDQPETIDMVYQWRAVMDDFQKDFGGDTRVIMTEAYSAIDIVMQYYGNATHEGAHMPFNFQIIINLNNNSNAYDFKRTCDTWMLNMPEERTPNWVMGNHDQNRVGSRLGTDRIDMMNMMLLTLSGASVTFMGEEIGMTDVWISWKDTQDPQACNTNSSVYWKYSRDPERTPFQWDNSTSAGFSSNNHTWLPISPEYKDVNAANEETTSANSHLKIYEQLMKLRETKTLQYGTLYTESVNQNIFAVVRALSGDDTYITLINIWNEHETVDISHMGNFQKALTYEIVSSNSKHVVGETVDAREIKFEPKEAFVLKYKGEKANDEEYNYRYEVFFRD